MPPTTPPTIAPVLEDDDEDEPFVVSTPLVCELTTVLVKTEVKVDPLASVPLEMETESERREDIKIERGKIAG